MEVLRKLAIVTFFGMILAGNQLSAQDLSFSHSLGASVYLGDIGLVGATYSPRLNFLELDDEITVSFGTHLGLAFNLESSRGAGEGSASFALDLPIVVEINAGHAAHPETRSVFGGFFGFGFGYNSMGAEDTFVSTSSSSAGLVLNGGFRAIIREQPVMLRIGFLINSKEGGVNVLAVGFLYNFGDY